jgi:drug/metabolite transporter (DMT)-like permease
MWALFALGAAFLTSFNPILYKRMLKSTNATVVVWSVTLLSLPLLALFTFALTRQLPGLDALFALGVLGSAVLNVAAHLASTRSLKLADASLVTPLLVFSPVFTLLISAVFLGEIPSARGLLGVGLVLVGAYWLNHEPGRGWLAPLKVLALKPGVTLVLLAGLLWAITPLFEKTAIQHTRPESPQFAAFVATALLVLLLTPIVTMRNGSGLRQLALHRREALLAGLIAGIAPILGYMAFSQGLVGYVTTLFRLSTAMTVLWGALILKEPGLRQRLPSSLVMIAGAILMAT